MSGKGPHVPRLAHVRKLVSEIAGEYASTPLRVLLLGELHKVLEEWSDRAWQQRRDEAEKMLDPET